MVHVEIFLGGTTGLETIGARYQKGVIQIFPSYQFESKLWTLKEYHFCSIETWLDGICKSHCSEHPWINKNIRIGLGGKSIFDCEDDNEDISAGDEDLNEENQNNENKNQNNLNNNEKREGNSLSVIHLSDQNFVDCNDCNHHVNNSNDPFKENSNYSDEDQEDPDMIGGGDGDEEEDDTETPLKKAPSRDNIKSGNFFLQ